MPKEFEVNFTQLNTDIDKAERSLTYIKSNLKAMFDSLNELNTTWKGDANAAFANQVNIDYEFMEDVCKNIQSLLKSLEYSKNEYKKSESSVYSSIRAMKF